MKAVCYALLLGFVFSVASSISTFGRGWINPRIPVECYDEKRRPITDGPCEKKFKISNREATWSEASNNCKSENTELATINNYSEQLILKKYITQNNLIGTHLWLGATDEQIEGQFRWIGENFTRMLFTWWDPSSPCHKGKSCVYIHGQQWHDTGCEKKKRYVCEYYKDDRKNQNI